MQIVANSLSYVVQLYCILFQKGSIAIVGPVALRLWCILAPSMNMNKRCSPKWMAAPSGIRLQVPYASV